MNSNTKSVIKQTHLRRKQNPRLMKNTKKVEKRSNKCSLKSKVMAQATALIVINSHKCTQQMNEPWNDHLTEVIERSTQRRDTQFCSEMN